MRRVTLFSVLLVVGLIGSQWLPAALGPALAPVSHGILLLTMVALAFIMIHVGYEFEIDRSALRGYAWDYLVAFTAASFPWLFVTLYFVSVMLPTEAWTSSAAWKESLLVGRFASPTSAGVLFSMLAAAGLSATWLFRKARILAIFDDLDTVILLVPLQMLVIGWAWQLGVAGVLMIGLLASAYVWLRRLSLPITWPWVLGYAMAVTVLSELVRLASTMLDERVPIHLEVLLPAFALGCLIRRPPGGDPHRDDVRDGHQEGPETPAEQRVSTVVSAVFMMLVGLNMPPMLGGAGHGRAAEGASSSTAPVTAAQAEPDGLTLAVHVLLVTALANLGKMAPALSYRHEANWRERLALAISMWPRGEVGAGILVIGMSYGIGGPILTVAMLSLALNLVLTGVFVLIVKRLMQTATVMGAYPHLLQRQRNRTASAGAGLAAPDAGADRC
jgi:Kef-type K+ transport system membrane component KefB